MTTSAILFLTSVIAVVLAGLGVVWLLAGSGAGRRSPAPAGAGRRVVRRTADDEPAGPRLAAVRQLLLDELESRAPGRFRRWLERGAMAGLDPEPFLGADRGAVEPGPGGAGRRC
ncbi:hypothetical protein SAMN04489727_4472 [Amycolatopsis tolypomycina]|uniref:Uncharacterized protein n=1 Tax=Amycolatopsis tolypomycina TaxID=208445 RepID=A0A1H4U353_9PSEU|nr:hypothetical protein [Amycolatopsis tolypomycina]SEC63149.1 hypothetical protein SAMN04489727_4472 [Amycolatopsis tolypomycina]